MKASTLKPAVVLYLAALMMIHAVAFWNIRQKIWQGYPDFAIYYCAGTIVREGLGHQLYDSDTQFRIQRSFAREVSIRQGPLPYNHPPFEALLFVPLTYLSYPQAFLLWDLANLAMLAALPFLLRPHLPQLQDYSWPLWMLLSLAFSPVFFNLLQGQDAILLLFLYTLAFVCLSKGRLPLAGLWLALALFKFHLVLPFVVLLLLQKRRVLYGFLPAAAALALISVATVGWDALRSYPHYVLYLERNRPQSAIVPSDMPNLRGILYLFLDSTPHLGAAVLASSVVVFLFAAWQCRGNRNSRLLPMTFSLAVVATVLVSYHVLRHDLSILMLPIFLLANELLDAGRLRTWQGAAAAVAMLFFSPLQLVLSMRYALLAIFGGVLVMCLFAIGAMISSQTS
jgi:hypothetical protein